ncbi:MAG: hypothetical protein LBP77_04920 [Rickettsiales bacterium]|jgi:hypothetical protein|nr:hypothetical protein [Rickettsiales bacterium]
MTNDELASVARRICSLAYTTAKFNFKNEKVLFTDFNGYVTFQGECRKCGKENIYENVNYFAGNNWISCNKCKEKYMPILPSDLKLTLFDNISNLIVKYGKVAFWGITQHTLKLFEEEAFSDKQIIFMDSSYSKQLIKINGKTVFDPKILKESDVKIVVCCYPKLISHIKDFCANLQVENLRLINVSELLIPNASC